MAVEKARAEADARMKAEAEARAKAEADAKKASICADLAAWLRAMVAKARDIDRIVPRFIAGNREASCRWLTPGHPQ